MGNSTEPATQAELEERLNTRLNKMDARMGKMDKRMDKLDASLENLTQGLEMLRSEVHHISDNLLEAFRGGQTELLKAFYSYAQTTDLRS